jgi:hypothetical protein
MPQLTRLLSLDVYDVNKTSLHSILKNIKDGRLQLPNLQRSWRWPDNHIVSLIESIGVNHPVGAIMAIETGGELKFENRGFEGTEDGIAEKVSPLELLLDGQQRCTALFQACYADRPVSIMSEKKAQYRRYFFDMGKAMYSKDASEPLSSAIISLPVDWRGVPKRKNGVDLTNQEIQFEKCIFPVNEMFRFDDWEKRLHAYWDDASRDRAARADALQTARDFRSVIVQHFISCMMPVILLRRDMSVAAVCKVYENLNSKGVALEAFDLLISSFAARGYSLRDDWYGRKTDRGIYKTLRDKSKDLLEGLDPKQFLQAVALASQLANGRQLSMDKDDLLGLKLEEYKEARQPVIDGFMTATRFMTDAKVFSPKMMPSMLHILGLAVVFAHIGSASQRHDVRDKLHRWLWNSIYSSAFEVSSNQTMAAELPGVIAWLLNDGLEPHSLRTSIITVGNIKTAKRSGNFYKAVATGVVRTRAADFATGADMTVQYWQDLNPDDHHIFPTAWCKRNGIPSELYDSVINKTPLSAKTNRQIGGSAPSEYLAKIEAAYKITPEALDSNIMTHGIDPQFLRTDDFYGFFDSRLKWIIKVIESDTGKAVISDDDILALQSRVASEEPDDEEFVPEGWMFEMNSREGRAFMRDEGDHFVVLAGSTMASDSNPSLNERFIEERDSLVASGKVRQEDDDRWLLLEDYIVKSASQAASVFSGQKAVGGGWRDRDGNAMTPSLARPADNELPFADDGQQGDEAA